MKILFVSSGNNFKYISPIVESQYNSLIEIGLNVDVFPIKGKGFFGYLSNWYLLKKKYKKGNYDIVHAHFFLSGLLASLAGCKPLVISFMGSDIKSNKIKTFLIRQYCKYTVKGIIVKSKDSKETLKLNKAVVIPNGVDLDFFREIEKSIALKKTGLNQNKINILFLADPKRKEKNVVLAEDAVKFLGVNYSLNIVYNIEKDLVPYYLNASDCVLMTSIYEGSPNIIKEAMACNRPIVSTKVGDVSYIINGTSGCCVCNNNPLEISDCIKEVVKYSKSNGRLRIMEIGLDKKTIAEKLLDYYNTIIH